MVARFNNLTEGRALQLLHAFIQQQELSLSQQSQAQRRQLGSASPADASASSAADFSATAAGAAGAAAATVDLRPAGTGADSATAPATDSDSQTQQQQDSPIALPRPEALFAQEKWFGEWWSPKQLGLPPVVFGAPLTEAVDSARVLAAMQHTYASEYYMAAYNPARRTVYVLLSEDCDQSTLLKGKTL